MTCSAVNPPRPLGLRSLRYALYILRTYITIYPPLEPPARSLVGLLFGRLLAGCCQSWRDTPLFDPYFKHPKNIILFKTLKITFGTLRGWVLEPSTSKKCGFRVGGSSFLRFSRFLYEITIESDYPSILGSLGAPFGRPWGVPRASLGTILGHLGPLKASCGR